MKVDLAASRYRSALLFAALALPLAACSSPTVASPVAPSATASAPATSASPSARATSASPVPSATSASPTPTPTASGYTMAQVKKHNGAASCWSVVDGTVYDLTKWVNRHPGGRARILEMCGRDGTALFQDEHGKESRPNKILAGYELGKLS